MINPAKFRIHRLNLIPWFSTVATVAIAVPLMVFHATQNSYASDTDMGGETPASCFRSADTKDPAAGKREYVLTKGDALQVQIYQREDLSGIHQIAEDGMISLPLLGRLHAGGNSLPELEALITKSIEQSTGRSEHVSVQLNNRRPVYVLGLVNRPGSYPYATDMTVLHAIAAGGGLFRPVERGGGLVGLSRENARISESSLRLKQNLALKARLEAELQSKTDVAPPNRLLAMESKSEADAFMERQTGILQKRIKLRTEQLAGLRKTADLTRMEIQSLSEREQLVVDQIELANEELKAANVLNEKGLMRRSNLFTIHRIISGLESDRRAIQARIVAAKRELLQTTERIELFDLNENLNLENELNQAEINIESSQTAIRSSQWIVGELDAVGRNSEDEAKSMTMSYQVIRSIGQKPQKFSADELTSLCPGDIVRIEPSLLK